MRLKDVDPPRLKRNGVRIRNVATAVTASDCLMRGLRFRSWRKVLIRVAFGVRAPRMVMGMIASGEVVEVGSRVRAFRPGDHVLGMDGFRAGACAEEVCRPAVSLTARPSNLARPSTTSFRARRRPT